MNLTVNPHDLLFLLAPAVIAMISRPAWPAQAKFLLAVGTCVIAALAEVLLTGQGTPPQMGLALGKAFTLTMTAYAGIWKGFLPQALSFLENRVNPGPCGPPPPAKTIPAEYPGVDAGGPGLT